MSNKKNYITYFNTGDGDCSILSISENNTKKINILFDMGDNSDNIIQAIEKQEIEIDGIVVTHVDQDHIKGIIKLLRDKKETILKNLSFIVFNAFNSNLISYKQGNELENLIKEKYTHVKLIRSYLEYQGTVSNMFHFFTVNERKQFNNLEFNEEKILITFIAPEQEDLKNFMKQWEDNRRNGIITNKSSIVCLIETGNANILMTGDQKLSNIKKNLDSLKKESIIEKIDCMKLSHHGTENYNDCYKDLIRGFSIKNIFNTSFKKCPDDDFIKKVNSFIEELNTEELNTEKLNTEELNTEKLNSSDNKNNQSKYHFYNDEFNSATNELIRFEIIGEKQ